MKKRIVTLLSAFVFITLVSACSDGPKKKTEYVVTRVTTDREPGYRHYLREVKTNAPTSLHLPTAQFTEGEHVIIHRTRRKLVIRSTNEFLR